MSGARGASPAVDHARRTRSRYRLLLAAVLLVCVAWTVWATVTPCAHAAAGRGGAIGVVLALGAIWIKPELGVGLLRLLREGGGAAMLEQRRRPGAAGTPPRVSSPPPTTEALDVRVTAIETAILLEAEADRGAVRALAAATAIGTAFWGFADVIARHARLALETQGWLEAVVCS